MDIMKIMSGKMDPINYSKPRMEEKVKELRENDRINGFSNKREINQDAFYPRGELDYILRQLNSQRLDEPFMFDQMQHQQFQQINFLLKQLWKKFLKIITKQNYL